jgi:hypothetical protein
MGSSPAPTLHRLWKRKRKRERGYLGPWSSGTGKEYECVVVNDYGGTVYSKVLYPKSEAAGAFKVYGGHGSMKLCEVMTDDREKAGYGGPISSCVQ